MPIRLTVVVVGLEYKGFDCVIVAVLVPIQSYDVVVVETLLFKTFEVAAELKSLDERLLPHS